MEGRGVRRLARGSALLAAGLLVVAAAPVSAQDPVTKVGYVSPEPATDYGWNEQGKIGAEAAANSVGAAIEIADGVGYGPEAVGPILNQFKEQGVDFIVAQASGYGQAAAAFAAENDIPVIVYDYPDAMAPGLVANIGTDGETGGYLAGVLAATMSQTGVLGIVLSSSTDQNWLKQAGGFVQGARSVNPAIRIEKTSIPGDDYADAQGGNQVTAQLISLGADIIFGMGDGSSFGMLAAVANNTPEGADKAWFIDVIGDKTGIEDSEALLSSLLWDLGPALTEAVAAVGDGTFGQQNYVLNVANGGLRLLDTPNISDAARAAVETAKAGLTDGTIAVQATGTPAELDALLGG